MIELLETLCDSLTNDYERVQHPNRTEEYVWARSDSLPADRQVDQHLRKEQRKQLGIWCAALLEDEEDRLAEALKQGDLAERDDVKRLLCASRCEGGSTGHGEL